MRTSATFLKSGAAFFAAMLMTFVSSVFAPTHAQDAKKPNILFIMGDDIGWMQTSYYHRGLMVGETPISTGSAAKALPSPITMPRQAAPPAATPSSPA